MKNLMILMLALGSVNAFAQIDATNVSMEKNLVWLTVKSDTIHRVDGSQRVTAMLTTDVSSSGSEVAIRGASRIPSEAMTVQDCVAGLNCQNAYTDAKFYSAIMTPAYPITVKFSLADLCSTMGAAPTSLCEGDAYLSPHSVPLSATVRVVIGIAPDVSASKATVPYNTSTIVKTFIVIQDADQNVRVIEL